MAAVALRRLARRRPLIYSANNLESALPPRSRPRLGIAPRACRRSSGACWSAAAETWMPSRADLDGARELAPAAKLRYVPNVVDVAAIDARRAPPTRPRRCSSATSPTRPTARGSTSCSTR